MKSSRPPLVTTWLLVRFVSNAALVGDLAEQRAQGRSQIWYRRQALLAILASLVEAVTSQKVETLRVVLLGWGGLTLLRAISGLGAQYRPQEAVFIIHFVGGVGMGWLITRLEPSSRGAMVLLCGVSFVLPFLPAIVRLMIDSFEHLRFVLYLLDQLLGIGLVSIGITIGGLLGIRPAPISGVIGEIENS
jgi:hypothetical protein